MTTPVAPQQGDISPELHDAVEQMLKANVPRDQITTFVKKWSTQHPAAAPAAPAAPADEKPYAVPRGAFADRLRSVALGATFGMAAKPMAFLDVLGPSNGDTRSFGDRYQAALKAERGAQGEFAGEHPKENIGLQLAGGLAPAVLSGGAGAAGEVGTGLRLLKAGLHAGGIGAVAGAVNEDGSFGDRAAAAAREGVVGGVLGGALTGLGQVGGAAARATGLSTMLSKVSSRMGEMVEGTPAWSALKSVRDKLAAQLQSFGGAVGAKGEGAQLVSERLAGDLKGGAPLAADVPGVEKLAVHYTGPETQSLAQGVLRDKGGRTQLRKALVQNQAGQRPALENELTTLTGEAPGQGTKPLRAALVAKKEASDEAFDAARAASEGQSLDSPEFQRIIETPAGKLAYNRAKQQMANRGRALPTEMETIMHRPPTPPGLTDEKWTQFLDEIEQKGLPVPGAIKEEIEHDVPNAEVAHMTKQQLARISRMGVHDTQAGALSSDADAAQRLWAGAREQLPEEWRAADAIASEHAQRVEAMRAGLNIFNTKEIPPSPSIQIKTAKGQLGKSLEQITANVKEASPEVQEHLQRGSANAAQQLLRSSPDALKDPGNLLVKSAQRREQLQHAFRSPADFERFKRMAGGMSEVAKINDALIGGSPTDPLMAERARRAGVNILGPLFKGNFGEAGRNLGAAATKGAKANADAEIARILSSVGKGELTEAQARAQIRATLFKSLTRVPTFLGVQAVDRAQNR